MGKSGGLRKRKKGHPISRTTVDENEPKLRESSLCWNLAKLVIICNVGLVGYLYYAFATSPISSIVIQDYHDVREITWSTESNKDLQKGVKLLPDITGAVSVAVDDDGNWYTGLEDGRILKISDGGGLHQTVFDITKIADYSKDGGRLGKRPLGVRIRNNKLYVADAYQGLIEVDITSNDWRKIVGYDDVNPPMMLTDDLTITKDGMTIYFTDVSTKWSWDKVPFSLTEGECSGRIFKVNVNSKRVDFIKGGLCFPNGIQLNPEETKVVVSEHGRSRLKVVSLDSAEIEKTILLPGGPDKIRASKDGGYWVTIPAMHNYHADFTFKYPSIRNMIASILGTDGMMKLADLGQGVAVKLDKDFEPVSIHFDPEGKVARAVTEVRELDSGELLLGSFVANGIAKVANPVRK